MSKSPLRPLGDRIVAVREEAATKTTGGLYLPTEQKEKSQIAKVIAIGSKVNEIEVDDRIVVREYSTSDIKVDGIEYLIVKEEDVLSVVE